MVSVKEPFIELPLRVVLQFDSVSVPPSGTPFTTTTTRPDPVSVSTPVPLIEPVLLIMAPATSTFPWTVEPLCVRTRRSPPDVGVWLHAAPLAPPVSVHDVRCHCPSQTPWKSWLPGAVGDPPPQATVTRVKTRALNPGIRPRDQVGTGVYSIPAHRRDSSLQHRPVTLLPGPVGARRNSGGLDLRLVTLFSVQSGALRDSVGAHRRPVTRFRRQSRRPRQQG